MPGARRLVAAVGLASALASCGGGTPPTTADGPSTTAAGAGPAPTTATPDGPPSPAVPDTLRFTAEALDGSQVVGADYAGRDVALWFWAPW